MSEEETDLEYVPPVLSLVVQPLVQHLHDLHKVISERSDSDEPEISHLRAVSRFRRKVLKAGAVTHWL